MITRQRLLTMRAEIDAALAELGAYETATPVLVGRIMKPMDFATYRHLSPRTVRDYCDLGMPHEGEGRSRRILVIEAERWIANGGPRRARMARKGEAA